MTTEAVKQSVEDVGVTLQRFGTLDYIVFLLMLGVCALIGIYFGFFDGKMSAVDYLMGGRSMSTFPVAMSLIASFISGITLLGTPSEIYVYGTQYVYIASGVLLMAVFMGTAFLPVFHDLQLTSTYEYLEKRFDKRVRLFGSFLFSVGIITWMPIVIYVPALAFNQVTGVNVHVITPVVCAVCIFYTCVGGMKAVVWTDVIQTCIMFGAMLLVIIKGTLDIGGISVVWERNFMSGRIEAPNFELNLMTRHTFWVLMFGGFAMWLQINAVNQNQLQRYLSLPTLTSANRALGIFVVGVLFLIALCSYSGLLIFATFHECDPLTTKLVQTQDQLLPLLVMNTLGLIPGLPGLFMAGVFSAALSSLSTGLNSMAAVVLEDLYKSYSATPLTDRRANLLMRAVVVTLGILCVSLVFAVERLGSVLQMSMSLSGITNGASLGVFSAGLFLPWVNSTGALFGGAAGMVFMSWIVLGTQAVIASGDLSFEAKPVSVEGCSYDFVPPVDKMTGLDNNQVFALFRMSYLWYTLLGSLVSMLVALVVSYFTQPNKISSVDRKLLSPVIRRFLPRKTDVLKGVDITSINGCKINMETMVDQVNKRNLEST